MSEQLREILQQCAVGLGGDKRKATWHTHVSQVQPNGKYAIGTSHLENFWNEYCDLVSEHENPMVGIAERPKDYGPVLVDIDLKVEHPESTDLSQPFYTEDHVQETISIYQSVLRRIVEGCTDENLTCVLLERPPYRPNPDLDTVKNGFHLHFPNMFLTKDAQRVHLIPRVRDEIREQETFDEFVADSGSVVDDVSDKHWLLYGSTKNELVAPYRFTKVYNYECKEVTLEEAFKHHIIYDMDEEIINIRGSVEYYLPRILSIVQHRRPSFQIKKGVTCPVIQKAKRSKGASKELTLDVADALRLAGKLLPMLAEHRAVDRDEWMAVGWALYNIGDGCLEARDLWLQHSQRSKDYDETACCSEWDRMIPKDVTLGTLRFYAEIDNPIKYQEFKKECVEFHLKESVNGSHYDISQILYAEYGNEFVCAQIKPPMWFQFVNHRWKEIDEGTYLFNKISREVVSKFTGLGKMFMSRLGESEEMSNDDKYTNAKIDKIQKLIASLKNHGYKKNVMLEAAHAFYDERFKMKLDKDPDLVAFQNGVYDLKRNVFRAGRPEDFISQALPISYNNYMETDDAIQEINEFFVKVLPDTEVRNFFLDIYSDIFVGGNPRKIVVVWTGSGNNGKSIAQHLFEDMLGTLAVKLPTTLFSGQKVKAGQANPEMVRLAPPCRWGAAEEPDGGESLNIGLIKSMSGGDKMGVRDLFQKGKEIVDVKPMFMLTFICLGGESSVTLGSGMSMSIEKMNQCLPKVLTWDSETDGIVSSIPNKFLERGSHECVRLTLADGGEIVCTPKHKFLTVEDAWIEAGDIKTGSTQLKMGLRQPKCDDITESYDYTLSVGNLKFDMTDMDDRLRSAALARIIGYVLTDGTRNELLYIGHLLDTKPILDDIELLTGKRPAVTANKRVSQIHLPTELNREISVAVPVCVGGRVHSDTILPDFLYDAQCPTFVIRELIAAMFGGDGIVPCLIRNSFGSLRLVGSKDDEHIDQHVEEYKKLCTVLVDRFGVTARVATERYEDNRNHAFVMVDRVSDIKAFCTKIGFRYCHHKMYRATAVLSCLEHKAQIIEQNRWIVERVRELRSDVTIKEARNAAIREWRDSHGFWNESHVVTMKYLRQTEEYSQTSVDFRAYLDKTGLMAFMNQGNAVDKNAQSLPTYSSTVVGSHNAGIQDVYDLNMDERYSNFVAEGIVTHNCNKLPRIRQGDGAFWDRMKVIPFEAVFVRPGQPCPETYAEQLAAKRFPMDMHFSSRIPDMLAPLAWMLLEHRKKPTLYFEPEKVREATNAYRRQNDDYRKFIQEQVIEDDKGLLPLDQLFTQFRFWFNDSYPNRRNDLPDKDAIKEYFILAWGEASWDRNKFVGYRIRSIEDDLEGDPVEVGESGLVDYSQVGVGGSPI